MNPLQELLALDDEKKRALGVEATPAEMAQQPEMWRDTAARVSAAAPAITKLLAQIGLPGGAAEIIFCGAGTSDFVGRCVQGPVTAALGARGIACPTTDIVTHPEYAFPADRPALMVS
ncbi:MAG: sugar isomerase, partial [Proteobacteria bacterium]|nr:sugar isomerase [Pseudomonadota bacterium]